MQQTSSLMSRGQHSGLDGLVNGVQPVRGCAGVRGRGHDDTWLHDNKQGHHHDKHSSDDGQGNQTRFEP